MEKQIEKILKILQKTLFIKRGRKLYDEEDGISGVIISSEQIAALYEGWYPGEFVEWLLNDCDTGLNPDKQDGLLTWVVVNIETHNIEYMTTEQAFRYWQDNVEGK
jgi:hypothetical protein